MIGARFGNIFEKKQKKTNKRIFSDDFARDTTITCRSKKNRGLYEIKIHGLKKQKQESRDAFIEIIHSTGTETRHKVVFVLDCSHPYKTQQGLHVNLTENSKTVLKSCQRCRTYFKDLNHTEVLPIKLGEVIENFIDADLIWAQIEPHLRKTLFSDYTPYYQQSNT
ncbi:MAG TPA: hypothetical protein VJC21_03245 [Candidatus Nanoarchaeia archaeon]|nr:hypothetical protein [Candidatus Nanoarchaeia archaeon]